MRQPSTSLQYRWRRVGSLKGVPVACVAAANRHTVIATSDGRVFSWGSNLQAQLGYGTSDSASNAAPRVVEVLKVVLCLPLCTSHACDVWSLANAGHQPTAPLRTACSVAWHARSMAIHKSDMQPELRAGRGLDFLARSALHAAGCAGEGCHSSLGGQAAHAGAHVSRRGPHLGPPQRHPPPRAACRSLPPSCPACCGTPHKPHGACICPMELQPVPCHVGLNAVCTPVSSAPTCTSRAVSCM